MLDRIGSNVRSTLVGAGQAFIYFFEPLAPSTVPAPKRIQMDKLLHRLCHLLFWVAPMGMVAQDPIHFWPLDESNGTTAADLSGGAHGTLQNGPVWAVGGGHLGGGVTFDGANDRIDLGPVDITTGTGISIACWVKPSSTSMQDQLVVAKAYDPLFGDFVWSLGTALHTAVRFRLQTVGNTTAITSPPNSIFPGAFYHLAATYDGTGMQIFINGALVANANKSGFIGYHPQALAAMGHLDIGPGVVPFEGIIGDVRIWDRALTPSEIIDLVLEQDISMSTVPSASANDPSTGPFTLFDANGRMILRSNSIPTALQTDVLPPGLYVLTSYDGAGVRSAKWMKP